MKVRLMETNEWQDRLATDWDTRVRVLVYQSF
jgi:hypothetical protein